jgi:hypothetical protein
MNLAGKSISVQAIGAGTKHVQQIHCLKMKQYIVNVADLQPMDLINL